jgi:C4-dicarboxylate-specific signal transduction histidine kinase
MNGAQNPPETTIGISGRILQLVLPAPELQAVPLDSHSPIVLRVLATWPHGTDFRYDLEYYGLEAGRYDLAKYLQHKDGTPVANLPEIPVVVASLLQQGQVQPNTLEPTALPHLGGYQTTLIALGVVWVLGLTALLFLGRRRAQAVRERARPRTLAEELRPLVEDALAGRLSRSDRARLELRLVEYWRRKLDWVDREPQALLVELRAHPQAGALLRSLEDWLHRPDPPAAVDLAALLAPYEKIDMAELEGARS